MSMGWDNCGIEEVVRGGSASGIVEPPSQKSAASTTSGGIAVQSSYEYEEMRTNYLVHR